VKEFAVAAKARDEDDADISTPIEFKVGDDVLRAYRPEVGQVAIMYARMDDTVAADSERIAAMIDFFMGLLDKESRRLLTRRLMDRDDDFEMEDVNDILNWLMEEWSGRPTRPSSASSRSRQNGGRKSTGKQLAVESTPSDSASIAS
jgi:hypothetical protein